MKMVGREQQYGYTTTHCKDMTVLKTTANLAN